MLCKNLQDGTQDDIIGGHNGQNAKTINKYWFKIRSKFKKIYYLLNKNVN